MPLASTAVISFGVVGGTSHTRIEYIPCSRVPNVSLVPATLIEGDAISPYPLTNGSGGPADSPREFSGTFQIAVATFNAAYTRDTCPFARDALAWLSTPVPAVHNRGFSMGCPC